MTQSPSIIFEEEGHHHKSAYTIQIQLIGAISGSKFELGACISSASNCIWERFVYKPNEYVRNSIQLKND